MARSNPTLVGLVCLRKVAAEYPLFLLLNLLERIPKYCCYVSFQYLYCSIGLYLSTVLSNLRPVYDSQIKKKKNRQNLTLMTHDREPCQLVPNMANDSSIRALPHWQRVYGSQIEKKDRLNLTLMTGNLVNWFQIWLMILQ